MLLERLTVEAIASHLASGGCLLDIREPVAFAEAHARGALNIAAANRSAPYWVHTLVGPAERMVLLTATDHAGEAEALLDAAERHALGSGRFDARALAGAGVAIASFRTLTPDELAASEMRFTVVDVRSESEFVAAHVPDAIWIPLEELAARQGEVPQATLATICASGFRSSTAASILEAAGRTDLVNVWGGTTAWVQLGHPVEHGRRR